MTSSNSPNPTPNIPQDPVQGTAEVWTPLTLSTLQIGKETTWDGGSVNWDNGAAIWDLKTATTSTWTQIQEQ